MADMPFIKRSTYQSVVNTLRQGALIVVPVCNGRRGHPVGYSSKLYRELAALQGNVGARLLLEKYESEVQTIRCSDPGVHVDIDTPEDFGCFYPLSELSHHLSASLEERL